MKYTLNRGNENALNMKFLGGSTLKKEFRLSTGTSFIKAEIVRKNDKNGENIIEGVEKYVY